MSSNVKRDFTRLPSYINSDGSFASNDSDLLQTLHHHIESSKSFLRANKTWKIAEVNREILRGGDKYLEGVSNENKIIVGKLRRQGREIIGNASNIRPNFTIRTAKTDQSATDKAATYEDLKDHWWRDRFVDVTFKEGIQEAASCIGYLWQWPEVDPVTGQIEIQVHAKSYKEVFPYQIGADNNLDKAYSVTIWCEMPLAEFREKFPEYANISATRSAPTYLTKKARKSSAQTSGLRGILNRGLDRKTDTIADPSFPTIDVFYTFTRDNSYNDTDKDILMGTLVDGDLAGHDSYKVKPYSETKSVKESKLFPFRRLTIWTHNQILHDGPPKWITFKLPIAEFRFERLAKEYLGVPITNDGRSLEDAINQMINSIYTRAKARAQFPIGIDEGLNKKVLRLLEKRGLLALVGKAIKMDFRRVNKPIQALFDKDLFAIEKHEFEIIKDLYELLDYVVGTNDFSNLQRKNQVPAADTVEAFVQSMGVLSVDHEREIAFGIARFGQIWLQFAPQVYNLKKRITIIGANAVDIKDLDYDPENLVPSLNPKAEEKPYWKRLREHLDKFNLLAQPGSMQERQSVTNKLTLLQMLKSGVPISTKKLYNTFINDGRYDEVRDEWKTEQEENAILAAKIRKEVEAIAGAGGSPEGGNLMQQFLAAMQQQKTMNEGRPSTDRTLPRQEVKTDEDGVTRATNATN